MRSTGNEVAVYERETGNRYLRMDNRSFASKADCEACAKLIADLLTQAQKWAG